ncbi:MAG: MATE family efflux transporter, partial [Deltaproteobacteria bacterium]|nr:MATE family efflux transporter [Deltaproteobacteria bacterium]
MGTDPVWRLLFRFSGPAIISMTVASTYNVADAIFVGRLGSDALAAMSVTFPLLLSFIALAAGTGVGATSLISRSLGAGEKKNADIAACIAITLCLILSALIWFLCLPNIKPILAVLGAKGAVLSLAEDYVSVLIKCIVFSCMTMVLGNIIRAEGNPVFASSVMVASSITNIILDPLFIFGLGPVPAMGIKGAAIATVIAQALCSVVYFGYLFSGRAGYEFRPAYFFPYPKVVFEIYRIGAASIVRSGVQFIVMGFVNRTAASHGVITLALIGVLIRLGRFVQMPAIGIGQGLLPLIGYNFGAGKMKRVTELLWKASLSGVIWTGLCWVIILLFPGFILTMFNSDPAFLAEGVHAMRLYFIFIFILGVQMVPGFFFQGIGKGFPAIILSGARHLLFLLPMIILLTPLIGVTGLWVSFPIADMMTFLVGVIWVGV